MCLVYEDFAGRYKGGDGGKMIDLVFSIVFWDADEAIKVTHFHDTFSRGSLSAADIVNLEKRGQQDAFVYRDTWLFALDTGIFDRFHTIIKSGDNGGSLKCYEIFYFAGMIWKKYKKRVIWCTLGPHHAYAKLFG